MVGALHQREIGIEEKPERNESSDIDTDVLPVVPVWTKLIPRSLKKLFMQYEEASRNEEVGPGIYLVMDNIPVSFIEEIERNSTVALGEVGMPAVYPVREML